MKVVQKGNHDFHFKNNSEPWLAPKGTEGRGGEGELFIEYSEMSPRKMKTKHVMWPAASALCLGWRAEKGSSLMAFAD